MKKQLKKMTAFLLIFGELWVNAQSVKQEYEDKNVEEVLSIGFTENLSGMLRGVTPETTWKISGEGIALNGMGEGLLKHSFEKPGYYTIIANVPDMEKEHGDTHYTLTLKVEPIHMEWQWNETKWYQLFNSQKTFDNSSVNVPVIVYTYNDTTQDIPAVLKLNLAGIDCNLTGEAKPGALKAFKNGEKREIPFVISGSHKGVVYAMMDFTDPFGRTTSFPFKKPFN